MSWPMAKLGDVITFRGGGTPRKDNSDFWSDEIPWATVKDFKSLELGKTKDSISRAGLESSAANLIPAGHVIIPTRMALGKAAINSIDLAINQDLRALIPKADIEPKFLLHAMLGLSDVIQRNGSGATVKGITQAKLSKIQIPVPPLAEQKRIAGILDAADALRAKRRESLAQLDTLLQSTFLDMFGDPVTNPMGFSKVTLKTAFRFSTGKLDSNAGTEGGRYPFFTCARETYAIDEYAFDCEALLLAGNNANADYSVKHYRGKFNAYQRTYVITVDEGSLSYEYARVALEYMLGDLKRFSKGSNTKYLTLAILNRMPILIPPIELQRRFAAVAKFIETQKAAQHAHLEELDTLFASLQSRSFRGDL